MNGLCFCAYSLTVEEPIVGAYSTWEPLRKAFHVGLPAQALVLELVDNVLAGEHVRCGRGAGDLRRGEAPGDGRVAGAGDELFGGALKVCAGFAVIPDALGASRNGGEVVGQARVRDAVVVRRGVVALGEGIDVGGVGGVTDDLVVAVVLHHDDEQMVRTLRPLSVGLPVPLTGGLGDSAEIVNELIRPAWGQPRIRSGPEVRGGRRNPCRDYFRPT